MRVAIFVLTLLTIATSPVAHTQALEGAAPEFRGAIPVIAMTGPGLTLAELSVPVARQVVRHVASRRAAATKFAPSLSVNSDRLSVNNSRTHSPVGHPAAATSSTILPPLLSAGAVGGSGLASTAGLFTPPSSALRAAPQPIRSIGDHMLTGLVALMLIAYQLRRKHRVLRPHAFAV